MNVKTIRDSPHFHIAILLNNEDLKSFYDSKKQICEIIDKFSFDLFVLTKSILVFRGVSFERLDNIIKNGIDVHPTDSPIFTTDDPCKALEYGWDETNKTMVLLMYKDSEIKPSYNEISSNTPKEKKDELLKTFPSWEYSIDGSSIRMSKLAMDDNRIFTPYERSYGGYIPGNPFNALIGVFYIGKLSDDKLLKIEQKINEKIKV